MNQQDVTGLLRKLNNLGYSIPTFVKFYLKQEDKELFKEAFINEYNKHIDHFKKSYEEIKEKENRDWVFEFWPSYITNRNIKDAEDGLIIKLETYELEYYGTDIQPIVFDDITSVFSVFNEYEYEGIISENAVSKYPEPYSYIIGNKGREQYDYTYNWVKEYIEKEYSDYNIL